MKLEKNNYLYSKLISILLIGTILFSGVWVQNSRQVLAAETSITITVPADGLESTIAPGRDFYVSGVIEGTPLPDNSCFAVDLYKDGNDNPIRTVYTTKKDFKDGLYVDYPLLDYYASEDRSPLRNSMMPDLVYDGENLDTFKDAWRKCYYNDSGFTALISGGIYNTDINLVSEAGEAYEPLEAGTYTIVVTATDDNGNEIAKAEHSIRIGVTRDKVLMRFMPFDHSGKVIEEAELHNYRVYIDPIAGYWEPSDFIPSLEDSDLFCEIKPRWKMADALEYSDGCAHFYIMNVSPTSATYSAEVGSIQYTQSIDNPNRLKCYYHDIGEATLPNGNISSNFIQMAENDRLALTRIDYQTGNSQDNQLVMADLPTTESDLDLTDGVIAAAGQVISVNGVVRPIQNRPSDIIQNSDNGYTMKNRIEKIRYILSWDHSRIVIEKEVGLNRISETRTDYSLLEFKHDLKILNSMAGKNVNIKLYGFDAYNKLVKGTCEEFTVFVEN